MAGGAPLRALDLGQSGELEAQAERFAAFQALERGEADPVTLAAQWQEEGSRTVLPWFYQLLSDMVKLKMAPEAARLNQPLLAPQLQALAEQVDLYFLQALAEKVQQRLGLLQGQVNQQTILEDLLLAWQQRRV
jgi:hypothetical protein